MTYQFNNFLNNNIFQNLYFFIKNIIIIKQTIIFNLNLLLLIDTMK